MLKVTVLPTYHGNWDETANPSFSWTCGKSICTTPNSVDCNHLFIGRSHTHQPLGQLEPARRVRGTWLGLRPLETNTKRRNHSHSTPCRSPRCNVRLRHPQQSRPCAGGPWRKYYDIECLVLGRVSDNVPEKTLGPFPVPRCRVRRRRQATLSSDYDHAIRGVRSGRWKDLSVW